MDPSSPLPALQAHEITKTYGQGHACVTALDAVSLRIEVGSFTAIMGPSGSGKSTLMHVMAGLDSVDTGTISLGAETITELTERQMTTLRRERIGFVFQSFNLLPELSARENILLPLELSGGRPDPERWSRLVDTLGLAPRLDHRPYDLSGGEQQRVACARALLTAPAVVFADEPTGNLDQTTGMTVLSFLRTASREDGQTIVMVTHDPRAAAFADRVIFLADGRVQGGLRQPSVATVVEAMSRLGATLTAGAV